MSDDNQQPATSNPQLVDALAMRSAGALAYLMAELDVLDAQINAAPLWLPGRALRAEIAWVRERLEQLGASWGNKLVVAIVGPSGAGKSTLLNALAGRNISATGLDRPTTRQVVVYAQARTDVEELIDHVGEDEIRVETASGASALEYLVLVDTPDTNTLPENQRLLSRMLERADLILTVFAAQNPKLHDNIAFLEPYVRRLPAESVVPVLNMVDRVSRDELERDVVPDFRRAISEAWGIDGQKVYLLSAKASVPGARFPADEEPLHGVNQFGALRTLLFDTLNRAGQVTDRRLAHAEHLLGLIREHICRLLEERGEARSTVEADLGRLSAEAHRVLGEALLNQETEFFQKNSVSLDLHSQIYGLLGPRWWGPMGWLITLWALILRFVAFLGRLGRPSPLITLWGGRASPLPQGEGRGEGALSTPASDVWLDALARLYAREWPPIADGLVQAGFDPAVREATLWQEGARASSAEFLARGAQASEEHLAGVARRLSAWPLQLLFNAPVLGMVGWAGARTVLDFFAGRSLPADYFRTAGVAALVIWLISFVLFQGAVALSLRRPWRRIVARIMAETPVGSLLGPLQAQLQTLKVLQRTCQDRV